MSLKGSRMSKAGFNTVSNFTLPGRIVGDDKPKEAPKKVDNKPIVYNEVMNGIADAAFEGRRQLTYYKDLELYLTAQLQAVKTKIKETEEELNNAQ